MHEFRSESRPRHAIFAAAAFGAGPRAATAELPAAADAAESWLRAVALGGQGRYAAARTELRRTPRLTRDPALHALASATEASLLRQLGWHADAAVLDGRALTIACEGRRRGAPGVLVIDTDVISLTRIEAVCDALTGLAADALGTGRPALAARLLERCRQSLEVCAGWRALLRWHWVCAETALAVPGVGLIDRPARDHAEAAVEIAEHCRSARHLVKSRLLLAAATAAEGDLARCAELAAAVEQGCREHGLLPLRWATAMLRSGVEAGRAATRAAADAEECARELALCGGLLRSAAGVADAG